MDTGATAALYWYTPHFSGNQSFDSIFQQWFGSLSYKEPLGGILYNQVSTGKIFLVTTDNSTMYHIPDLDTLLNYSLDSYQVVPADDATLAQYTDGGDLTSLVWDSNGVYLVNNGIKHGVPSVECTNWGLACSDGTVTKQLGSTFQSVYLQSGSVLTDLASINPIIYKMQNGNRLPFANSETVAALGYSSTPALALSSVNSRQPLGNLLITTPAVVKFRSGTSIYYFDGSAYHKIPDMFTMQSWGISSVIVPPASAYDTTPPSVASDLSFWYQDSSGSRYVIDQGHKILLNVSQQALWPSAQYQTFQASLAQSLPTVSLSPYVWSNPAIYFLSGSQRHLVPSLYDISALGISGNNITSLSPYFVSQIASGGDQLGSGRLIKVQGGDSIYVLSSNKLVQIPDIFALGMFVNAPAPVAYSTSILTSYPASGIFSMFSCPGVYGYAYKGKYLALNSSLAFDFGLHTNNYSPLDPQACSDLVKPSSVSRFFRNSDDGALYYASGQALHYITSFNSFAAYGGTSANVTAVDTNYINSFNIAQPI